MTTWNLAGMKEHLFICNGESCMRSGGEEVTQAIREEIALLQGDAQLHTTRTRCNGRCHDACVVIVYPEGSWYREVTPEVGRSIVRSLLNHVDESSNDMDVTYRYNNGLLPVDGIIKGIAKQMI